MKRFFPVLFAWYFLVQGYGTSTNSSGFNAVVGPFKSQEQCQQVANQAARKTDGWVTFRVTSCWEAEK